MPLFEFKCGSGHLAEHFVPSYGQAWSVEFECGDCGAPMIYEPTCGGLGLLWAEEGRPRTIYNLGDKPVTVRSLAEHRAAMKKAGVTEAGSPRGAKGRWF